MGEEKRLPDPESPEQRPERNILHWLNSAKGLGVVLVIFGHLLYKSSSGWLNNYIYAFHMPLFFIISGYLQRSRPRKRFLADKALRLLVPYLCFSLMGLPLFAPKLLEKGYTWQQIAADTLYLHAEVSNRPLWFLVVLFEVYALYYLLHRALGHPALQALFCSAALGVGYFLATRVEMNIQAKLKNSQDLLNTLGVNRAVVCFGFFLVGMLLQRLPLEKARPWQVPAMAALLWGGYQLGVVMNGHRVSYYHLRVYNYPCFVAGAVCLSLGILLFARLYLDRPWYLARLSRYSVLFLGSQYLWIVPFGEWIEAQELARTPTYDRLMVTWALTYIVLLPLAYELLKRILPFVKLLNGEKI